MNKRQKETQQVFLNNEKAVLKQLEGNYKDALNEINNRIAILRAREDADLQHVIYQIDYQKALKAQVQTVLDQLHNNNFETVSEYLTKSYEDGFIGTMYDLQGQDVYKRQRYSNEGDTVYDPFGGLMTVPMTAVKMQRYGKGCELNPDYFRDGVGYLQAAENEVDEPTLFDFMPGVMP